LARVWGSSPAELADDVFEHSSCGIVISVGSLAVVANAAAGHEQTKVRALRFPFTMNEFEVLLRTVEQDAKAAMNWQERGRPSWSRRVMSHEMGQKRRNALERKAPVLQVRKPAAVNVSPDDADDISRLWIVPIPTEVRTHIDLDVYEQELGEYPIG